MLCLKEKILLGRSWLLQWAYAYIYKKKLTTALFPRNLYYRKTQYAYITDKEMSLVCKVNTNSFAYMKNPVGLLYASKKRM